jgi:CheY-like chemotaxis protein
VKEIIDFLLEIEKMAGDIYKDASAFFKHDEEFARFLSLLAEDEASHLDIMVNAGKYLAGMNEEAPAFINLSSATKKKIERPFMEIRENLLEGNLTKEIMISCIVTAEFSEWNHVFLYVVNTFRDASLEFQRLAAKIHEHKKGIETFLESLPDGQKHLEKVRRLPGIWREKILVVEDNPAIAELLSIVLAEEGMVKTVENGEEGLRKTSEEYFDVIVSDVDMPIMSGIEFYKQAAERDTSIGERFLFFTGYPTSENIDFFEKHNLRYMTKPADIDKIRTGVRDLLLRTSKKH